MLDGGGVKMISKDMTIGQVLREYPSTAEVFFGLGMHCLGCPSASMESIEGAARTHGRDPEALLKELNEKIAKPL